MAKSTTSKDQTTKLENSTFNILIALGKEAQFLYSTIDTYISDAQKDNNSELENTWNTIKEERKRHMDMLRRALEKEAKEEKLSQ
jgi:rubrerythrin